MLPIVEPLAGLVIITTGGVVSATDVMLSANVGLVVAAFLESPVYVATTLREPADSAVVEHAAALGVALYERRDP